MPDVVRRFLLAIAANPENDVFAKLDLTHGGSIDNAYDVSVACKDNTKRPAVFYLDATKPSELFQNHRIRQVCIVNYDQYVITGNTAAYEKFLGDISQLAYRPRDFLESDLRQKRCVKVFLFMAIFIDNHTIGVLIDAGKKTI